MMQIRVLSGLLLSIAAMQTGAETYRVTFTGTWNAGDISSAFPSSAHFTELVGGTHISGSSFWEPGELATTGIEMVAEVGDASVLSSDVEAAIQSGTAGAYIQLAPIYSFPGSSMKLFDIFQDKPEVTLISMIAPSPDWFIGVYGLSLYDQSGWVDSVTVNLVPWDAGTEDGNTFSLVNPASNPQAVIAAPPDSPFIGSPVIGQLTFERVAPTDYDLNGDGSVDAGDLILMKEEILNPAN